MPQNRNERPVVLIVEDEHYRQSIYCRRLCTKVSILQALTLESARNFFQRHLNNQIKISIAVIDGSIGTSYTKGLAPVLPNTIPLIEKMRACGFTGPIIASTGVDEWRGIMMKAGCSHSEEKDIVPALIRELLLL